MKAVIIILGAMAAVLGAMAAVIYEHGKYMANMSRCGCKERV